MSPGEHGNEHELKGTWTFWYLIPDRKAGSDWQAYLTRLTDFKSAEQFWRILNTVEPPACLPVGCRYYIFKQGIKPLWEDPQNEGGYSVAAVYEADTGGDSRSKPADSRRKTAEEKWEVLCAAVLGSTFPKHESVNGIEFNCRRQKINVGVWIKHVETEPLEEIKAGLKELLEFPLDVQVSELRDKDPKETKERPKS